MPHIRVPEGIPGIRSLLAFRPEIAPALGALTDALLYAPNSLSRGDRELIGAYVSRLNGCAFCHASHAALAACHLDGNDALVATVVDDPQSAGIPDKLKALLEIARLVQQDGRAVTGAAVARARERGATDLEIHDTVLIAALFCLFNRYVDGLDAWTPGDPDSYRERARVVAEHGYAGSLPDAAAALRGDAAGTAPHP